MEVKLTVGFNQETLSVIESFIASFGGSAKVKKTAPATNGVDKTVAASNGVAKEEPQQTAENTVKEKDVTIEQVRAAVQSKAQAGHREKIKALLAEFNVAKVTELQPADHSAFLEKVNAL